MSLLRDDLQQLVEAIEQMRRHEAAAGAIEACALIILVWLVYLAFGWDYDNPVGVFGLGAFNVWRYWRTHPSRSKR